MDKSILGLVGAMGALAVALPAQDAHAMTVQPDGVAPAASYADLFRPIPNARALLDAADAAQVGEGDAMLQEVQYHHHHHHHHHHFYRRRDYHHRYYHHHHHRYGGPLIRVIP